MKFKHIKHDKRNYTQFEVQRHFKYQKCWDYKDEIMFQIKNGHSTKGLGYGQPWSKCDVPYNTNWYRRISSNRKLIKKMWSLRTKYEEIKKEKYSLESQIKILESKSRSLNDTIKQI